MAEFRNAIMGAVQRGDDLVRYYTGPHLYNALTGALDTLSPVQDYQSALEGSAALAEGIRGRNVNNALAGGAAMAAGLGAVFLPGNQRPVMAAADGAGSGARRGITAYHGSPHDFDRFSMDKIGTGEGAQAYGHGLYFAENEGVARSYRDMLSRVEPGNAQGNAWDLVRRFGGDADYTASILRESKGMSATPGHNEFMEQTLKHVEDGSYANYTPGKGRMYQVRIDANPEDFLDWDKPLSEQPEAVQRLAEETMVGKRSIDWRFNGYNGGYYQKTPSGGSKKIGDVTDLGRGQYRVKIGAQEIGVASSPESAKAMLDRELSARGQMPEQVFSPKGRDIYEELVGGADSLVHESPNRVQGTERMLDAGIPGIRYLDAGSRGAGDVNGLRGTVSMWEAAVRKSPNDDYARQMLERSQAELAAAEGSLSRNYVVFDDKLITILKKYGLVPAAVTAGAALHSEDVQAAVLGAWGDMNREDRRAYLEQQNMIPDTAE